MNLICKRWSFKVAAATAMACGAILLIAGSLSAQSKETEVLVRTTPTLTAPRFFDSTNIAKLRLNPRNKEQSKINALLQKMKQTDDSKNRNEIKEAIEKLLHTQYTQKMDSYQEHLAKLEDKLQAMRSQLERRRDAQQEMVDLRMKVLLAEADDLGWPADVKQGRFPYGLSGGAFNAAPGTGPFDAVPRYVPSDSARTTWTLSTTEESDTEETDSDDSKRRTPRAATTLRPRKSTNGGQ
jgi:hypothetical protein